MQTILVNVIATLVILCIVGFAIRYIYKEKKKGTKCIGCPMAGNCAKARAGYECQIPAKKDLKK